MARSADFRSAQEIHAALRARGNAVGLATGYRALQTLVDHGLADVVQTSSGEAAYRECSRTHYHHLVCRRCGSVVEVNGPAFERWTERTARGARPRLPRPESPARSGRDLCRLWRRRALRMA
ncbi:MAG: transcriptional repressor [Nocardioides sp.]|nr:transcriptional repressor [Nocardioides sp.]